MKLSCNSACKTHAPSLHTAPRSLIPGGSNINDNISLKSQAVAQNRYKPRWFSVQIPICCAQDCARFMQLNYLYLLNEFVEQTVSKDNSVWVMTHTAVRGEFFGPLQVKGINKN